MFQQNGFMVCIGASAGGMKVIRQIVAGISKDINAAIAIVVHMSREGASQAMVDKMQQVTELPCHVAADNMPLVRGNIYLAAGNLHMIIKDNKLLLGRGPAEGRWRPSIDLTFRSAAAAWDTHCIGVILTGMLDDGVAGMDAIRKSGGRTIVQDPAEAEYASMPEAVLANMEVDKCLPLGEISGVITALTREDVVRVPAPEEVIQEAVLAEQVASRIDHMLQPNMQLSMMTCPDCGGSLWEMQEGKVSRYRCHIGHHYTEGDLMRQQVMKIEETLWIALRMMEQRRLLLYKIADKEETTGFNTLASTHHGQAEEMDLHIERLKELLFAQQRNGHD
jgi:two-component system chemotaxis response regulator CheB